MPAKEELTQVEKDKLHFGFDFDFREIAKRPADSFTPNELAMFKWTGIYQQLQKGFFMIRLRMPGGLFTSKQLVRAAEIAEQFAQDELCITTRQCLQYHWVRREDLYKVIEGMKEVGILTKNACGDVTRNVVSCPLMGVCPHEEADTFKMLRAIADHPELLDEQRNLSRKHKISVAGCGRACAQTLMNCQGWYPVTKHGIVGWKFHAGGGLGSKPYLAKAIFEWVPAELVVDVARASTEVYRRLGNRRVRALARLKIVVDNLGAQGYAEKVLEVLRERKVAGIEKIVVGDHKADVGESFLAGQPVIEQKTKGLFVVRAIIRRSEMSGQEARRFAEWAEKFGDGTLVFTHRQNLLFRSVPEAKVKELSALLRKEGYITDGFEHVPDIVACVGTTVCNLAVADTPNTYKRMMKELAEDAAWWRLVGPVRINMNGCPNSCAQHAIADIGLRGLRKRTERGSEEGYSIFIGGSLAGAGRVAEPVCDVTAPYVVPLLRRILDIYLKERRGGETFGAFARRITAEGMKALLGEIPFGSDPVGERNQSYDVLYKESLDVAQKKDLP